MNAHAKPTPPEGNIELATTDPVYGGYCTFTVTSDVPNLFVHLLGRQNGLVIYEGWQRWYIDQNNHGFILQSPGWDPAQAAQLTAYLEDWANYYRKGDKGIIKIDSTSFEVPASA